MTTSVAPAAALWGAMAYPQGDQRISTTFVDAIPSGLVAARREEAAADRRMASLLATAARMPAGSIAGVLAKLAVATEWSAREPEPDGHPWTVIRTALDALTAVARCGSTGTAAVKGARTK